MESDKRSEATASSVGEEIGTLQSMNYVHTTTKLVASTKVGEHFFSLHFTQFGLFGSPEMHADLQLSKPQDAIFPKAVAQVGVNPNVSDMHVETHAPSILNILVQS